MAINSDIEYICSTKDAYPQLSHASNIITKYNGTLTAKEKYALTLLIPEYARYLKKMLEVLSYDKESIAKRVDYLNRYYNFMHENELDRAFSAQGKFRPTILEEFLFLLFKDLSVILSYGVIHSVIPGDNLAYAILSLSFSPPSTWKCRCFTD